jgi:hypothetical protein
MLNSNSGSPIYTTFDGQSVDANTILVKYTYYGDANLDGLVNGSDYTAIDNGFNAGLSGWSNGDFNYDGVINGDDYALIDNSFNMLSSLDVSSDAASPQDMVATVSDQIADVQPSAVPEPSTMGLLAAAAAGLLIRRHRKPRSQSCIQF